MGSSTSSPPPNSDQSSRFDLPGLNLPLNWQPLNGDSLFPSILNIEDLHEGRASMRLTPRREFTMLQIMNSLTDKLGWEEKVLNDEIAEKWKTEAMTTEGRDVTQEMADWVIAELRYKAEEFKTVGAVSAYDGDVVKSDTVVSTDLKESLQLAVKDLEDIPEHAKDYHPGSGEKVLDLVHPSLFPLIYGLSKVLPDSLIGLNNCIESCGKGYTVPIRADTEMHSHTGNKAAYRVPARDRRPTYSKNYQWLPAEVAFSEHGIPKFSSYINNLHPVKYKHLYSIIEAVLDKTIPLWNMSLSAVYRPRERAYKPRPCRIPYTEQVFNPDPDQMSEGGPQRGDDEDSDTYWERRDDWERSIRRVVLPNPGNFIAPTPTGNEDLVDLKRDYASRGLQIIVKLANIELTPEKPTYEGGTWHVEGQLNEHICATALYYYSNSNISSSNLAFRQNSDDDSYQDIRYAQDQHDFLSAVFGCENEGPTVQEIGSVACTEGRLLTFPNILQHRVTPFSLADPTKPGHRKILALFLVDPGIRIISTANVPPQQRDWWAEAVQQDFDGKNSNKAFGKLSQEICDKVFESVDKFPIGLDEAKDIRLSLMEERKDFVVNANEVFESLHFSLCEH